MLTSQPGDRLRLAIREPLENSTFQLAQIGGGERLAGRLKALPATTRQDRGKGATNNDTERSDVVVGYPPAESQQTGADDRLGIHHRADLTDVCPWRFVEYAIDPADPLGPAERHTNAHTRGAGRGRMLGHGIGEGPEQRQG